MLRSGFTGPLGFLLVLLLVGSCFAALRLNSLHDQRVLLHPVNGVHQFFLPLEVKQLLETDRLFERGFQQYGEILHIAVVLDMRDHLFHEINLLRIQRLVVDERREGVHRRLVIHPGDKKSAPEETPFRIDKQEDYSFVLHTSLDTVTMGHTSL